MTSMVRLNHVTADDFVSAYEKQGLTPAIADYAVGHEDAVRVSFCALLHWESFARLTEISVVSNFKSLETMKTHFEKQLTTPRLIRTLRFLWRDEDSEPWRPFCEGGNDTNIQSDITRLWVAGMPFGTYQCAGILLSPLLKPEPSKAIKDLEREVWRAKREFPWADMPNAATAAFLLLKLFERGLISADMGACEFYTSTHAHNVYENYSLIRVRIILGSDKTLFIYFDGARDSHSEGHPFIVERLR